MEYKRRVERIDPELSPLPVFMSIAPLSFQLQIKPQIVSLNFNMVSRAG
jgi:hypothetical protein